jgi:rare lipoprotein A
MKRVLIAAAFLVLTACRTHQSGTPVTAAPGRSEPVAQAQMTSSGTAGWIGQEFAGRTTANGEIFDPMLMTGAHRTLPFGSLVDVRNPKTGQTVRVRINDRGPYVGDRLIDLSYAAAQQIGLAESGGGEVEMAVAKVGRGDREPPAAFAVTVPDNSSVAATPPTEQPAPQPVTAPVPMAPVQPMVAAPATVDTVQVVEEHSSGIETRRQVAANGTSIVDVPVNGSGKPVPVPSSPSTSKPRVRANAGEAASATPKRTAGGRYTVQVGAFSQEGNAKALQQKLKAIGQEATVDHTSLYHVRIGPFETRDQAATVRSKLETSGISAIIVSQ